MDRMMVYPGAIPLETDLLNTERDVLIALGWAIQGYLGTSTIVDGFTCVQTTVPSQSVQVTPGQILTIANVDNSAFSSLPADTTQQIIKQGLMLNTATFTCPAPLTVGQSVNYLIEVAQSDIDGTPVTLPYFNPANPALAFSGPNGLGTTNNTVRQSAAIVQIKTGTAATSGSQVTPTVDPGFTGMFVVTVAFGQTTITSTNISILASAPFIPIKLPQLPAWVQGGTYGWAADAGSANQLNVTLNPAPTSIGAGFEMRVKKIATASTGAMTIVVNGNAAVALLAADGTPMSSTQIIPANYLAHIGFDGTSYRFLNGVTASAVGSLTASSGEGVAVNGSGVVSLNYPGLSVETTQGVTDLWSFYSQADGHHRVLTWAELVAAIKLAIPSSGGLPFGTDTGSANAMVVTTTPSFGALVAGQLAEVRKSSSANNGAVTLAANGLAVTNVVFPNGTALSLGDWPANTTGLVEYDGVNWNLQSVGGVASTTARGVARQATLTEAANGVTSASAPAFVTPEGLAGVLAGIGNPWTTTGVGALVIAYTAAGTGGTGGTATNIGTSGTSVAFAGSWSGLDGRAFGGGTWQLKNNILLSPLNSVSNAVQYLGIWERIA